MVSFCGHASLRKSARFEPGEESGVPYADRLQVHRPRDEPNSSMVQRKKMLHRLVNTLRIVDADVRGVRAGFASIHKYSRNVSSREFRDQPRVGFRGHD